MRFRLYNILCASVALFISIAFSSCEFISRERAEVPEEEPEYSGFGRTILFYDIASESGMASNFNEDRQEILEAGPMLDLKHNTFLMYSVYRTTEPPVLEKLVKQSDGTYAFQIVKTYDRKQYSTDPERLKEVIEYTLENFSNGTYGFIMAAHGSGWSPEFSEHAVEDSRMLYAIGCDTNGDKIYDWLDIDELADALPDNTFDFIWFDACYMGNIETIYQLRNKCRYIVAYPTEIYMPGMPYNKTVPHLLKSNFDLVAAAAATYDYYNVQGKAVTIAVSDMSRIEDVAAAARQLYQGFTPIKSTYGLIRYSRGSTGPFYDFGQYTKKVAQTSAFYAEDTINALVADFNKAMNDMVVYKNTYTNDFTGNIIPKGDFSGLSCHNYQNKNTVEDDYYRSLDWHNTVYKQ